MADKGKKYIIEIFRKKDPDELTAALADPGGKLDVGSAAALSAADACAMALRAARVVEEERGSSERLAYILRNLDKLRSYFVYLIDEDVKGRSIMRRAVKDGDPQKIEAARQPASAISDEIICQMINVMDLIEELSDSLSPKSAVCLGSAVELAMSSIYSARLFVLSIARESSDETYSYVVRRENEIRLDALLPKAEKLRDAVELALR